MTLDDLVSGLASETWVNTYFIPKTAIADNLTTDDATKVLSAKQGKVLQDALSNHKNDYTPHKLQDLENSRELFYGFEIDINGVLNFVLKEIE